MVKKLFFVVALSAMFSACAIIPQSLGGRARCDLLVPNYVCPHRGGVVLALISSGDEDSERAMLEIQLEHYEEASRLLQASLKSLISQGAESAHAHWLVGVSLERVERYSDALTHLATANNLSGGSYVTDQRRVEEKLLFAPADMGAARGEVKK